MDDISVTETTFHPDTNGLTLDITGFDNIEEYAKDIADQLWEKRIEWSDVNRPAWGEFYRGPSEHDRAQILPTALALYALTRSQEHTAQAEFTKALRTLANRVNRETAGQNSNPSTNIEKRLIELAYTILALCNYRDVRGDDTEQDIHDKIQVTIENLEKTVSQVPEINIETYYKRFYSVPGNRRPERYKLLPVYPNVALAFISAGSKSISSNYNIISRILKKYLDSIDNHGVYDSYEVGFEATLNQYWISKLFYEFTQIDTSDLQLRRIVWQLGKQLIATRIVILIIAVGFALTGAYLRSLEATSVWLRTAGFLCYLLAGAVLRELGILDAVRSIWRRLT